MKLKQSGNIVTGSYYYAGGQIQGTASGNDIYGNWLQNNHKSGTFDFSMTADCKAFSGKWRYGTSGEWSGSWAGTRQ